MNMTTTADKIERALTLAQVAGTPVMIDSVTLGAALDELRAARSKGKLTANLWDRGYAQGQAAEKRANAAGEQALKSKITGALEVLAWIEHGHADLNDPEPARSLVVEKLRAALEIGDLPIACPCGAA